MASRYRPVNKYQRWHDQIIDRSRARVLAGYVEKHHVTPRCLGGTNAKSNLVYLTPEEHYVVHQLLVKIYPGEQKLVHAVVIMSGIGAGGRRSNKLYGWLRRRCVEALKGNQYALGKTWTLTPETCEKISAYQKSKRYSVETRAKISASYTPERRAANRNRLLGNQQGLGNKSRTGLPGRALSLEEREQIRQRMKGNQHTRGMKLGPRSSAYKNRQRGVQMLSYERRKRLGPLIFAEAGCLEALTYG